MLKFISPMSRKKNINKQSYSRSRTNIKKCYAFHMPKRILWELMLKKLRIKCKYSAWSSYEACAEATGHSILHDLDVFGNQINLLGDIVPAKRYVTLGETEVLRYLIIEQRPKLALEIGLANGYSTIAMLQALADEKCGKLLSLDPLQESYFLGTGLMNLRRAGLEDFHFWWDCASQFALPKFTQLGGRIDFAFIDGNHLFDFTLLEFFYIDKILSKNGLIVFHDYCNPSVRACLNYIESNFNYSVKKTEESNLRIIIKQSDDNRDWYYYKPFQVPQISWNELENREFLK
jgi:hypothetical protein